LVNFKNKPQLDNEQLVKLFGLLVKKSLIKYLIRYGMAIGDSIGTTVETMPRESFKNSPITSRLFPVEIIQAMH
jgi:hypothetical protein